MGQDPATFEAWSGPICRYRLNCTIFGQLLLRKIITIVAARCQILSLKCTKFDFGWGSASDPAGGAYSAPPGPLAGFKGALLLRGEERKGRRREGRGWEGEGKGGRGRYSPRSKNKSRRL